MEDLEDPVSGVLKISVLSSGRVLLDGREVTLGEVEEALRAAKLEGSLVQYHGDDPASPATPESNAVMQMIADNRLRVSLSDDAGPRPLDRTSNIIELPGIESLFAKVRRHAAANRGVSLVTSSHAHVVLPAPPPGSISPQMTAGVKSFMPSDEPRNIAAVEAPGTLDGDGDEQPSLAEISRNVPFMGLLIALAYTGHAVWLFEGSPATLVPGCSEADVLIVDSKAISALGAGWQEDAVAAMRNANILVYDRTREKIGAWRTAGVVPGRIEFPN